MLSGAGPEEPPGRPAERFATALADSFLAGDWVRDGLLGRGALVVGVRARWLRRVVAEVLGAYPRVPADRPRELAGFVAASPVYRAAWHSARLRGRRLRVRARPVTATRTVRRPWPTPVVDDLAALADLLGLTGEELDWYADRRSINRHARDERLRHYRYTWLGGRLIEAPKPRLRALQRRLLAEVLGPVPVHPAVHGFVPGRSAHTFAAAHAGRPTVVRVDLVSFFATVSAPRIYGLLRLAGYPEPVAHTLTALCVTRTPVRVLRAAPAGLPDRPYRLALLRGPHLPQGAPTSPALANLCGFRLDRRLAGLAAAFGATYTRYADDLAFSGDLPSRRAAALVDRVTAVVAGEGFRVRPDKTRIRGQADRQVLAGLVVNARPAVPRDEYDRLRALLHNAARTGLAAQNRDGHPDFEAHLAGRIGWVGRDRPARAAKLRALFEAARFRPDGGWSGGVTAGQ
ncbi:reverse transcriptase family protein [Polymorphospora sp. NPDC051019]|uniref:reverse transcriptase family protein n=1 Tax=Polymorphospora sp. NPDC051019 TaxID=3155725 RepID=UPI0034170310